MSTDVTPFAESRKYCRRLASFCLFAGIVPYFICNLNHNLMLGHAYGPDYSNFPTVAPFGLWYEDGTPLLIDNYVVFKSPDDDEYPEILERKEFLSNWVLIYEDNQGRIYQATEMPDSE